MIKPSSYHRHHSPYSGPTRRPLAHRACPVGVASDRESAEQHVRPATPAPAPTRAQGLLLCYPYQYPKGLHQRLRPQLDNLAPKA